MKGIALCAGCADYGKKKHRCRRGAEREGDPRDPFYDDCPLPDSAPVVHGQWISVEESLPEDNKPVLVYCENFTIQGGHTVHIGSCDTMSGAHFWFLRTQPGVSSFPNHEWRVTRWMPLPESPKEGI